MTEKEAIDPEYRQYFLAQQIEELRWTAEIHRTNHMIICMQELMESTDCWTAFWPEFGGLEEPVRRFADFVQDNYEPLPSIERLPPVSVKSVVDAWIKADPSILPQCYVPEWEADELYLSGWLVIFALHEGFTRVTARVVFDPKREEFVIHGVREIEN